MGLIQEGGVAATAKFFLAAAKPCDYCNSAAAMLFCRTESAFMCAACDEEAHRDSNNEHKRVWMCEVCEQAPAAVTCKADAAALCVSCDRDIHSANLLAGRHERVPVVPFAESAVVKSAADFLTPHDSGGDASSFLLPDRNLETTENRYILDTWIPVSPSTTPNKLPADLKSMELFFQDSDQFLDLDNYQIASYGDSAVPVQSTIKPSHVPIHGQNSSENRFVIDFTGSNVSGYTTPSLSRQSVSSSLMDVGVVPEGNSPSEISYHFTGDVNSSVDLSRNQVSQVVGMNREARVLRYREKRRKRKFEKTIRYASRKAYAESRPRIKGRFAKRTDAESDLDRSFSGGAANFVADPRYGVNQTVFM